MITDKKLLKLVKRAAEEGFKWMAQEEDTVWWAYKIKPKLSFGVWVIPNETILGGVMVLAKSEPTCAPEDSLIEIETLMDQIKE